MAQPNRFLPGITAPRLSPCGDKPTRLYTGSVVVGRRCGPSMAQLEHYITASALRTPCHKTNSLLDKNIILFIPQKFKYKKGTPRRPCRLFVIVGDVLHTIAAVRTITICGTSVRVCVFVFKMTVRTVELFSNLHTLFYKLGNNMFVYSIMFYKYLSQLWDYQY